jgi:hypothetical protein
MAAYPSSIAGTWTAQANQTLLTIVIHQGSTGTCRGLSGTIGSNNLEGFYCPSTGRFNFALKLPGSGLTAQYYSGNLSSTGNELFMTGIFASITAAGGALGEYNFAATK